jgi:hypothetical protein
VIQGKFEDSIGAKAIGLSQGDFGFVVQALHNAAGNPLLSEEVVENQLPVQAQGAGDLLHGLDAGTHCLAAPLVEKFAGPGGRAVLPELPEGFLEKVSPDGLQVVAEEIAEPEVLLFTQILTTLEQQPAGLLKDRAAALCGAFPRRGPIEGLIQFGNNMEAVEDM